MPTKSKFAIQDGGAVRITLREHLDQLAARETPEDAARPRSVPTGKEIARELGVHPITVSHLMRNKITHLNLEMLARIIDLLRARGFATEISDLLAYTPPEPPG